MPSTAIPIQSVRARQILDSRGNPTIEVDVAIGTGRDRHDYIGRAAVPSGASTGKHEAVERRDGDPRLYHGKSVLTVIDALHKEISPKLIGMDAGDQQAIDGVMCEVDGTADKSRLGANAILAVSMAVCRGAATARGIPLWQYLKQTMHGQGHGHGQGKHIEAGADASYQMPLPMMNVLNGGAHADNRLDIQECMIIPVKAKTMAEAVRMGAEVFYALRGQLKSGGLQVAVGDEGGFAPAIADINTALEYLMQAIDKAGYKAGEDIVLAVDAAASEFYHSDGGGKAGKYHLAGEGKQLTTGEMIDFWRTLTRQYPIVSLEDGLAEDDWEGYVAMTETLGKRVQLVGDDLFATNPKRLEKGIAMGAANAILVKPNQIGTVTETLAVIRLAQKHGLGTIISHRSGETEDSFIADLAVATDAGQIKTGSLSRSDRTAKYNQLIRIEEAVLAAGGRAVYDGGGIRFVLANYQGGG